MQVFLREAIGVAQGDEVLFSDYEHDGEMWKGNGARERRQRITFEAVFRAAPIVQVALSLWDIDSGANARMDVSAENITREGFEIVFRTWADTRVARVRVCWMAIGAAHHPDDWQELE